MAILIPASRFSPYRKKRGTSNPIPSPSEEGRTVGSGIEAKLAPKFNRSVSAPSPCRRGAGVWLALPATPQTLRLHIAKQALQQLECVIC
jgi:hypothetical protein